MTQVCIAPTCASRGDLREYAEWLQGVPWQLFCTLTFAWPVSDWQAPQVFKAFMNRLERHFAVRLHTLGATKSLQRCSESDGILKLELDLG